MAVVDDRSGYGPTTLFLLGHSGTQAQLRALSVAAFHADNNTPDWHTLETVTATPAILKGRLQPSPDGQRLAYARTTGTGMGLLQWGGNELRVVSLDPGRLALSGAPLTVTGPTGRITGLDFSPAADYLYFTVSGLSYPTTQRLYRLPLAGGAIAPMAWHVTDVRRNAQQGGTHMLCTTTTGLRRIAQPDDASPTQTTHALPGIQPALALQPVLIGPDRSTSTRHLGRRRYELTDHLGNVRAVVGDRKLSDFSLDINTPVLVPTSFKADVLSYADYDPFGSLLDERHALAYRFGFNGKENDNEFFDEPGAIQDYGMRMYDPRIGRFPSVDPIAAQYPELTPYQFASNTPIQATDLDGLEADFSAGKVAPLEYTNPQWIHATAAINTAGAAWNTLVDLSELVVNILPPYNAFNEGAGYEKVGKGFASAATGAYDWTVNTSGAQKREDLATTFSNPHTYTNAAGSLAVGGALGKLAGGSKLSVATEGSTVSATEQVVYRALSTTDRAAVDAGKSLVPKGTGGSVLDHVRGKPTGHISASETLAGTARFNSGNGVVAINVNKAVAGGARFIPHGNVMQAVKHLPKQGMKVGQASEVLFDGSIAPNSYRLMD
ncbi:MAG: RHS repeat-associated core domain-containing protein [Flavobacteriales bacterium]|nr:RHS repeat-associated core domain-containing protein [Flavobacteriales bacterium]